MKLKVGMYVKYTRGAINGYVPPRIGKITDCSDKDLIKIDNGQVILKADILKASYDIIDLIEVGDYVNGEKVIALKKDIPERNIHMNSKNDLIFVDYDLANNWYYGIDTDKIKTVLTKEQYENNVYRIGD